MKAKKLVSLALPVMLLGGCATDKVEEKKTDSLKVAESEKKKDDSKSTRDIIVPLYKEVDRIYNEGQELQSKKEKTEEESKSSVNKEDLNDKVVEEAVIGGGRTLAEERALMDKTAVGSPDSSVTIGQYQGQIETHMKKLSDALQDTKVIVEKDKNLKTSQAELRKKFEVVKEQCRVIKELEPPKEYDYFKQALRDDMKVIEGSIDGVFQGLAENDDKEIESSLESILQGLNYLTMTVDEIRNAGS